MFQLGNSPLARVTILVAITSDQCRLHRGRLCARPLPTLMADGDLSPWAGKSLEHQLVQASSFTNWNKDNSKVTQTASQNHGPPHLQDLRIHGLEQDFLTLALLILGAE